LGGVAGTALASELELVGVADVEGELAAEPVEDVAVAPGPAPLGSSTDAKSPPGTGELPAEGMGELPAEGMGELPAEGMGELPAEGMSELPAEGMGELPAEGMGELLAEGMGEPPAEGMGEPPAEGIGEPPAVGMGEVLEACPVPVGCLEGADASPPDVVAKGAAMLVVELVDAGWTGAAVVEAIGALG
jgi:hypothetical protein